METQRKRERQGGSVWKGALCWFGSVRRVTALRAKASLALQRSARVMISLRAEVCTAIE